MAARGATSWKSKVPNEDPKISQARGLRATKVPPGATIRLPAELLVITDDGAPSVAWGKDL